MWDVLKDVKRLEDLCAAGQQSAVTLSAALRAKCAKSFTKGEWEISIKLQLQHSDTKTIIYLQNIRLKPHQQTNTNSSGFTFGSVPVKTFTWAAVHTVSLFLLLSILVENWFFFYIYTQLRLVFLMVSTHQHAFCISARTVGSFFSGLFFGDASKTQLQSTNV